MAKADSATTVAVLLGALSVGTLLAGCRLGLEGGEGAAALRIDTRPPPTVIVRSGGDGGEGGEGRRTYVVVR